MVISNSPYALEEHNASQSSTKRPESLSRAVEALSFFTELAWRISETCGKEILPISRLLGNGRICLGNKWGFRGVYSLLSLVFRITEFFGFVLSKIGGRLIRQPVSSRRRVFYFQGKTLV